MLTHESTTIMLQGKSEGFESCDRLSNGIRIIFKQLIFQHAQPINYRWMTSENNRTGLLGYIKLCAVFQSHHLIQAVVTIRKSSVKAILLSHVTLKFDGCLWKRIRHLFYATFSFVDHCAAICQSKLVLQSGNAHFGSKAVIFCPVWPWDLTDDLDKQQGPSPNPLQTLMLNFKAICKLQLELRSGNARLAESAIFCPMWPRNFTDDLEKHISYAT